MDRAKGNRFWKAHGVGASTCGICATGFASQAEVDEIHEESILPNSLSPAWCLLFLLAVVPTNGATLKPETLAAWNASVEQTSLTLQSGVAPAGDFLWALEDPGRSERIRQGELFGCDETFSVTVLNRAFWMRAALDAEYEFTNIRLDERRFYSTTKTTRRQEIEQYGEPDERLTIEGRGDGYDGGGTQFRACWKRTAESTMKSRRSS